MDQYHHGNLRAALLKAASALAEEQGFDGFTLREVARSAGVSHNAPYRHFRSREDLIAAMATEGIRDLQGSLQESVSGSVGRNRLRAAALAYLRFALQNPPRFQLMFHSRFDREAYPDYVAAYTESFQLLSELIEEELGGERRAAEDVERTGDLVWATVHGIAELGLGGRLRFGVQQDLERLVDEAVSTLIAGSKRARGGDAGQDKGRRSAKRAGVKRE